MPPPLVRDAVIPFLSNIFREDERQLIYLKNQIDIKKQVKL